MSLNFWTCHPQAHIVPQLQGRTELQQPQNSSDTAHNISIKSVLKIDRLFHWIGYKHQLMVINFSVLFRKTVMLHLICIVTFFLKRKSHAFHSRIPFFGKIRFVSQLCVCVCVHMCLPTCDTYCRGSRLESSLLREWSLQ